MIPGKNKIIECPSCKGNSKYRILISGNTIGATYWTDGKREAPMLPRNPPVVKCIHCDHIFWLQDASIVDEASPWAEQDSKWSHVKYVEEAGEEDYYNAIRDGLAKNKDEEFNLRLAAWWKRNDKFRTGQTDVVENSETWKANLEEIISLLNYDSENSIIMKAELFRELGLFDEALIMLNMIESKEPLPIKKLLISLCEKQDTVVRELKLE